MCSIGGNNLYTFYIVTGNDRGKAEFTARLMQPEMKKYLEPQKKYSRLDINVLTRTAAETGVFLDWFTMYPTTVHDLLEVENGNH